MSHSPSPFNGIFSNVCYRKSLGCDRALTREAVNASLILCLIFSSELSFIEDCIQTSTIELTSI